MSGHLARIGALLTVLALAIPAQVWADAPDAEDATDAKTHDFELDAFLAATWFPKALAVDAGVDSDRTIGIGGAISLAYRGPFFLYPFVDIGFYNLASSTIHPVSKLGHISSDSIDNGINAWTFTFGPGLDYGVMRFRLAVGFNRLEISTSGKDFDDSANAGGFTTGLQIAGAIMRNERFRLNVEGRWAYFMYAGSTAFMLGISGGADLFSW